MRAPHRLRLKLRRWSLLPALALASCTAPPVGSLCPDGDCVIDDPSSVFELGTNQVDVLFVIDNSGSMSPKQQALADNIRRFIRVIDDSGADYRVAVTTSDVGQCVTSAGEAGVLQNTPCSARMLPTGEAEQACKNLCPDPSFVPRGGARYIERVAGKTNVPQHLVNGKDEGPLRTFQCLALVGDRGCGLESPLEGARLALKNALRPGHPNTGFLRPNSTLAVIFITDEDDCSATPAGVQSLNGIGRACALGAPDSELACFAQSERCLPAAVVCDEPLTSTGAKHNCRLRDSAGMQPVKDYVDFFKGLRPASKLVIGGIWSPSVAHGGKIVIEDNRPQNTQQLQRGQGDNAACVYKANPKIFGQAQVRLSAFSGAFPGAREHSICEVDSYEAALTQLSNDIVQQPCLPQRPRRIDGVAQCTVQYQYRADLGAAELARERELGLDGALSACGAGCCQAVSKSASPGRPQEDPAVLQACAGEAAAACACVVDSPLCATGAVASVIRKDEPPPGTRLRVQCRAAE